VPKRLISAVKRIQSDSGRKSYIVLTGCSCHFILLNIHAPPGDTTDDVKENFYKELECLFNEFTK
jgi:hypothetical protein